MSPSTSTRIVTRAHTAVHLTNAIEGAIAEILGHLGISARALLDKWGAEYEPAIQAWIKEGSLDAVILECTRPGGAVEPIFEFPIDYLTDGSASLSHRHVALARQWVKINRVPSGTTYRVICSYIGSHTPQSGWGRTTRTSTSGLDSVTLGTLAAGPHARASVRCYTRSA
ncbi:MAG: hypothetical protein GY788_28025 [bacterium]|nr:hypothetical protein [bacterium]